MTTGGVGGGRDDPPFPFGIIGVKYVVLWLRVSAHGPGGSVSITCRPGPKHAQFWKKKEKIN